MLRAARMVPAIRLPDLLGAASYGKRRVMQGGGV